MNEQELMRENAKLRYSEEVEAAVNLGLMTAMFNGVAAGATVMRIGGVPLHVSKRVLTRPTQRRKSDWQNVSSSLPAVR
jgi:hypothetical protein